MNADSENSDSGSTMTSTPSNRLDYKRTQKALNVVKKYLDTLRVTSAKMAESTAAIFELSSKAQDFIDLDYNTDCDDSDSDLSTSSDGDEVCESFDEEQNEALGALCPLRRTRPLVTARMGLLY